MTSVLAGGLTDSSGTMSISLKCLLLFKSWFYKAIYFRILPSRSSNHYGPEWPGVMLFLLCQFLVVLSVTFIP